MQVGAGGLASVADFSDGLAGGDVLAFGDVAGVDVAVDADRAVGVLDADPQAAAAGGRR